MKKFALVLGLVLSIVSLTSCATKPTNQPMAHNDNGNMQTAPAKVSHHHIDYKGESLNK